MPATLQDVTRDFALGQATLETLREAARDERRDRGLAGQLLALIAEWDTSVLTDSARARLRNSLRERAKALVPAAPPPEPEKPTWTSRQAPEKSSLYEAGLRPQRRR